MNNRTNSNFSLRKLLLTALVAGPLATIPAPLWALPSTASTNLTTSSGVSVTNVSATAINVTAPDKAVLTWAAFGNVAQPFVNGDTLTFFQPSASSSVLNVVNGGFYTNGGTVDATFASTLNGTISANGNVYFLNPNGITLGTTAQVNAGGFYASTIGETLPGANFGINGTLTFSNSAVTTSTPALTVSSGAAVQAVGSGLNIKLYGRGVNVQGGSFYGNLFVASNGVNATFGSGGLVTINGVAGSGGNLTVATSGADAVLTGSSALLATPAANGTANVTTVAAGTPTTAANIIATVPTNINNATAGQISGFTLVNGGAGYTASLAAAPTTITVTDSAGVATQVTANVTTDAAGIITAIAAPGAANWASPTTSSPGTNGMIVSGNLLVDTTGASTNGKIYQGGSELIANVGTATLNAGTGTSAGNISLGAASFKTLTANGNNVTVVAPVTNPSNGGSSDLALNASNVNGNLTIINNSGQISAGAGTTSVGGSVALSQSGNQLSFSGAGNITFSLLQATSTMNLVSTGDITMPYSSSVAPTFQLATPTVSITAAPTGGTNAVLGAVTMTGGVITNIAITTAGAGYTAAPVVTISSGVTGEAPIRVGTTITAGAVTAVSLPSTNYNMIPASGVVVNGTATTPATANGANITAANIVTNEVGQITSINTAIFNANSGYTAAPTVTITGTNGQAQTFNTTINAAGTIASVIIPAGVTTTTTTGNNTNGNISRQVTVTSTGGKITGGMIRSGSTLSLVAAGDIVLAGLNANTGNSGNTNLTSNGGKITTGYFNVNSGGAVRAVGDITVGGYSNGLSGNFSHSNGGMTLTSTGGTISAGQITNSTTSGLTLSAAGDITLPQTNVRIISVTSTGGRILQSANSYFTQQSANTNNKVTLNAAGDITLTNQILATGATFVGNDFHQLVLVNGNGTNGINISGFSSTNLVAGQGNGISLAAGTSTKGNVSITSGNDIFIGTPSVNASNQLVNGTDSLFFGGNLTLTANGTTAATNSNALPAFSGTINTFANNVNVFGAVSLTTASNNSAVLGAPGLGNLANYNFGSINGNVGTGTLTVNENQTLNLGNITAATVSATSLAGNIINNAGAVVAPTVTLSAGSIFSPGNITLSNTGNQITQLNLINANNVDVTTGSAAAGTTVTAGSASINGKSVLGSLVVTELNSKNLTINTAGAGSFNNVGFNASGVVTVTAPGNVTLQNATNSGGTAGVDAVVISAPGVITIGSGVSLNSIGNTKLTATGTSGRIVDASPNAFIGGPVTLTSDNDISITKSGHSFGPVSLISGNAGGTPSSTDITYTEGGTANLNVVKVNAGGGTVDGSLKVVSLGGGVQQFNSGTAATSGYISVPSINNANTATFQAATGVNLSNPNNTGAALGNNLNVPITLTASTDSSILQGSATIATGVKLANVAVTGGNFIVDTSASTNVASTITQTTGSTIFSYGISGFKSGIGAGTNAITLANDGNNFGAISLATAGGNVSIKEVGTMNLASVVTGAGKLTANAGVGIIQSTNVATFGSVAAVAGLNVGGATSLTAGANGITLNGSNTAIGSGGITLTTTTGNVNISDGAATTTLGTGSSIGGTLTIRNTNAGPGAVITDGGAGNLTVGGNVQLELVNGNISISGPNNSFGAVGFRANTVAISENTTLNLNGSSVAYGSVTLSSNGDIITSGLGPLTFSGPTTSLTLSSGGNITISNASTFVANGLTFLAKGTTDLSALSLIGNLNGKSPTALPATGPYVPPKP